MPEIEEIVSAFATNKFPSHTFKENYKPGLDHLHEWLMDRYLNHTLSSVFGPDSIKQWDEHFPYRYYCNGSSEALWHLLVRHKVHHPNVPIYQFDGEYQGYSEYAKCLGLHIDPVSPGLRTPSSALSYDLLRPGVFVISVPSAVDGNVIDPEVIRAICQTHYVIIDCAYAGMGNQTLIEIAELNRAHNRIVAVVGSMSKPFGLYYHRIGFAWSRDPILSLTANVWFKNALSIHIGQEVLSCFNAQDLAQRYLPWQERACLEASEALNYPVLPSDAWLLGHGVEHNDSVKEFERGPGYRFCLTPYYMKYANANIHTS